MSERYRRFVALATIASLTLAALFGLETLLTWGRANDTEVRSNLLKEVVKNDDCLSPPHDWGSGPGCHREDDGRFRQRLWCLFSADSKFPSEDPTSQTGRPTELSRKETTFADVGWHDDWRIGLYGGSSADYPLPRILHPVSAVVSCHPAKAGESRQADEESQKDKVAPLVFVDTHYVPDHRRELNFVLMLMLAAGIFYGSALRERKWQVKAIRHDLRNMLQTLLGQLHGHFRDVEDDDARERMKEVVQDNIDDMLLVVDEHGSYVNPPERLRLSLLLKALVDGAQDERTKVTSECPHRIVVQCWETPLRRALENLIWNARKAAAGAGGEGWVRVRVDDRRADTARIVMENSGDCLPDDILKNFSNRLTLRAGGGIGLTVVREVVRRHGGRMTLRNAPAPDGRAVRVEVLLPYEQPAPPKWRRFVMRLRMP